MTTKEDIVSNMYGSIKHTYEQAWKKYSSITLEDIKKWLKRHPK